MSITTWVVWAIILLAQNFAFTFVSRARNSGSLNRHVLAAIGSNSIYLISLVITVGPMIGHLKGDHGILMQVWAVCFYTIFTVAGSVLAHYYSLKTENGKGAVGANSKYAQITKEEWDDITGRVYSPSRDYDYMK